MIMEICFASDNKYAQHMGVCIASILVNSGPSDKFNFYVLDGGISKKNINKLLKLKKIKNFHIEFIKMYNTTFKDCPLPKHSSINLSTYYRFVISSVLNVEKVLYLDCDIIVKSSLEELFTMNIDDLCVACVEDVLTEQNAKRLGIKKYFNAGVILFNLKRMREEKIQEKLFSWTKKNTDKIIWHDQDVLNVVLQDKVKYIDKKWNCQMPGKDVGISREFERTMPEAIIMHFISIKPWNDYFKNKNNYLYSKYLIKSPWKFYMIKYFIKKIPLTMFLYRFIRGVKKSASEYYKDFRYSTFITSLNGQKQGILFLPNGSKKNPYQTLLYKSLNKKFKFKIKALSVDELSQKHLDNLKKDYKYIHMHWLHVFYNAENPQEFENMLNIIEYAKKSGYKIIWTIHNLISNDSQNPNYEIKCRKEFALLCDKIIVHGQYAKNEVIRLYDTDADKVIIAPHGTYENIYPNKISRNEARKFFNIAKNEMTFLFFGRICGYKGIENLISVFNNLCEEHKNIKLIIAGQSSDENTKISMEKLILKNPQIILHDKKIPNIEIQNYFNACDMVVLPFKQILTSGSAMLALTFLKPLICPDKGIMREIVNEKVGILYDTKRQALKYIMSECVKKWNSSEFQTKFPAKNFNEILNKYNWDNIVNEKYSLIFNNKGC